MTKFNPENKDILTYNEAIGPAMSITEKEDAEQYKAAYIEYTERMLLIEPRTDGMTAEQIVNLNLGYYAGYYQTEIRERVERLFNCSHPIFGSIKDNGEPTNDQALQAGLALGRK